MPIYWGDYTKKTQHLSTLEHGAYLLLIAHYWNTGEPIPNNQDTLRRITRTTSKQWNQIAKTMLGFFAIDGDFLVHERVESELQTARGVSTLQSSKAQQRWKIEQKQQQGACRGNAAAMPITVTVTKNNPIVPLPDWLPLEDWQAFVEMRNAKKKPLTDRAAQMVIKKLTSFIGSPSAILQQSTINGWQDIFELRENKPSPFEKPKP
jgi:uncharacterized protein YdaU (DUF1376 family)